MSLCKWVKKVEYKRLFADSFLQFLKKKKKEEEEEEDEEEEEEEEED